MGGNVNVVESHARFLHLVLVFVCVVLYRIYPVIAESHRVVLFLQGKKLVFEQYLFCKFSYSADQFQTKGELIQQFLGCDQT